MTATLMVPSLELSLLECDDRVHDLRIRASHRGAAERWLLGIDADQAVTRIGMIYSLCRKAQQIAARAALNAAGNVPFTCASVRDEMDLEAEWLRELASSLFLFWPRCFDDTDEPGAVRALRRFATDPLGGRRELAIRLEQDVLGEPPLQWLRRDAAGLVEWCRLGATATALRFGRWFGRTRPLRALSALPPLDSWSEPDAAALFQDMDGEAGARAPEWQGTPVECGPLVRQIGHPLIRTWLKRSGNDAGVRMLARLVELAGAVREPVSAAGIRVWSPGPGRSVSALETARGVLVHYVWLEQGHIRRYRIIAPTDWNFHPLGVLRQALIGCGEDCRTQARAWLTALDPCLECRMEVLDA